MLRSWLGTLVFRRYVALITRRVARGEIRESETEGRLRRAREWLIRSGDPTVSMPVGRRTLRIPLSHQLPVYRALLPSYDRLLPSLARVLHESGIRIDMIDVGANIGDSMALVLEFAPNARFLCIEGHGRYAAILRRNASRLGADVEVVDVFCGDGSESGWRVADDSHGTARLAPIYALEGTPRMVTLDALAGSHQRARGVTLLKIDTDGSDIRVLRGASALLRDALPILLVEFHPGLLRENGEHPADLFSSLSAAGYTRARLYTNRGDSLGTFALTDTLVHAAESSIDGVLVEYLDILAWGPTHVAVIARLNALEAAAIHPART
ncbi:MAG: FkbM family methyltransferase [bacterium]